VTDPSAAELCGIINTKNTPLYRPPQYPPQCRNHMHTRSFPRHSDRASEWQMHSQEESFQTFHPIYHLRCHAAFKARLLKEIDSGVCHWQMQARRISSASSCLSLVPLHGMHHCHPRCTQWLQSPGSCFARQLGPSFVYFVIFACQISPSVFFSAQHLLE
jgi:hypothetical protein